MLYLTNTVLHICVFYLGKNRTLNNTKLLKHEHHQPKQKQKRSSYKIDLNVREGHEGYNVQAKCPLPPGFSLLQKQEASWTAQGMSSSRPPALTQAKQDQLTAKKKNMAMSVAMKPGQQILMNAFMMYMSGSQLNIWSITITSGAVLSPLGGILGIEQTFRHLASPDAKEDYLTTPKLIYLALNLVWLALGLYKMSSMRLLPTTSADWTHRIEWKDMMETTSIPPDSMIL
mmetsp:Transcript_1698/g.3609  ORF Transcript_1698/g.3609 Transcript_1698/m.3609 type:complete len:230 (-) Transcript_1698:201-890(-)